jgi:hypothetical protein
LHVSVILIYFWSTVRGSHKHSVYSLTIPSVESVRYVYATLFNTRVTITGVNRNETLQAPTRIPTFTLPPRSKARIVKDDTRRQKPQQQSSHFYLSAETRLLLMSCTKQFHSD